MKERRLHEDKSGFSSCVVTRTAFKLTFLKINSNNAFANQQDISFCFYHDHLFVFLWGFAHNLDPILIPHLKKSFTLSTLQSSLVDSAVFIAYFVMAVPAGFIMRRYGYKAGIIAGLLLFAAGSFLFIPAADTQQYSFFLAALFIIACGLTILETAANPYASLLGNPETSTQRLNLSQSFNGLAATLAPIIGARIILTKDYTDVELSSMTDAARKAALAAEASTVKMPYLILASFILLVALIFWFTRLPEIKDGQEHIAGKGTFHALRHRHLAWGVITQFFYVGAQVCVFSFFILYAVKAAGVDKVTAADYLGWGCGMAFMIGRFAGTIFMKFIRPERLLTLYALINIFLCVIAIFGQGIITLIAVIAIAFFMSIMFPTIFALGIKDIGGDTAYGSSLIIMSIVGGAILPLLFAYISDETGNIQFGYIVPLFCFAVVAFFGLKGYKAKPVNEF